MRFIKADEDASLNLLRKLFTESLLFLTSSNYVLDNVDSLSEMVLNVLNLNSGSLSWYDAFVYENTKREVTPLPSGSPSSHLSSPCLLTFCFLNICLLTFDPNSRKIRPRYPRGNIRKTRDNIQLQNWNELLLCESILRIVFRFL